MRVVDDLAAFEESLASAKREATAAFGDEAVLLERYLRRPRHIEFQILADAHGTTLQLGERECSIQRRHQKVIEEAPSVALDPDLRARMGRAAVDAARSVGYTNAGTVEFMLDEDGGFYFLEMNARLQVEHPVTELVYDVDLVHEQLRIAGGEPLRWNQDALAARGWAIEARLNAEDPTHDYLPQSGTIAAFDVPRAPGVRLDAGVEAGSEVSGVLRLDAGEDHRVGRRPRSRDRAHARNAARHDGVRDRYEPAAAARDRRRCRLRGGRHDDALPRRTRAAVRARPRTLGDAEKRRVAAAILARGGGWRLGRVGVPVAFVVDGTTVHAHATAAARRVGRCPAASPESSQRMRPARRSTRPAERSTSTAASCDGRFPPPPSADAEHAAHGAASGDVTAPMPGKIVSVAVVAGAAVEERAPLVVLEAMKMEHRIEAPVAGTVREVRVKPGELVAGGATLVTIGPA